MNKEKLIKIAEMAVRGTPGEQKNAKKILTKYGFTAEELLKLKLKFQPDIPEGRHDSDENENFDTALKESAEKLASDANEFIKTIENSINTIFSGIFKK